MEAKMTKQEKQAAYDAWFIAEVEKGIEDADAGNLISNSEMKKRIEAKIQRTNRKYGKKAA